jgi:hypothetical protein
MNFNYYHASDTAPIYSRDLKAYAADSKRSLADRKQRIGDAIHRAYETLRSLKPAQLSHIFLAVSISIIGLHCVYA